MKNRKREICTSGTVRDEDGNILIYSANDRGDRGDVGIIRSPVRASILPDHLTAGAVELLVEILGLALVAPERGDDKARIGFSLRPFGLGHDPAPAAPARARRPHEALEAALRPAGASALGGDEIKLGRNLADEPLVARQSGFTHVTARQIAQPPKAAFVTRLQPFRLPGRAARQLPDQSTTLWMEPSSIGDTRLRGALLPAS